MLQDVTRGWGGGCYWHVVGRGQGCCSNSNSAQGSIPQKSIKCQQCSAPGQPSSHVLEHLQRPLSKYTEVAPQTSPIPVSKKFPPQVSSDKTVGGMGEKREETILGTTNEDVPSAHQQLPTPTREKSQTWAIFGQTEKRKAELKGQSLDPTCLVAKVGV